MSGFKNFLVTGGAGFIGSHLAEALTKIEGAKVTVIDNLNTGFEANIHHLRELNNFTFIEGDINDRPLLDRILAGTEVVFHLAALGSVPRSIADPLSTYIANTNGFFTMLDASRNAGVKRFIYASSSSVYGDDEHSPKMEEFTGEPLSPYAATKRFGELMARAFSLHYAMEIIGLRYFNVFGPRQSPEGPYAAVIPLFIQALKEGRKPVIFGDGFQSRDFTYVENVVKANILAAGNLSQDAFGKVYNIACGQNTSLNQLMQSLANLMGKSAEAEYKNARKGDIPFSLADISKAEKFLGYKPQILLEEGLRRTLLSN